MDLGSVLGTAAAVLAEGGHEHGHGVGHGAPGAAVEGSSMALLDTLSRVLLLTGTSAVVGLGLLHPFLRLRGRAVGAAAGGAAVAGTGLVVGVLAGDASGAYAVPQFALTLAVVVLLRRRPLGAAVAALALLGVLIVEATLHLDGAASGVGVVHWMAAVLMVGAAVALASTESTDRRDVAAPVGALAVAGVSLYLITGLLGGWLADLRPGSGVPRTSSGQLVALEALLAVAALVVVFVLRPRIVLAMRMGAALALTAVAVGAGVSAAPSSPVLAAEGQSGIVTFTLAGSPTSVAIVPNRPGPNLIWVSAEGSKVGTSVEDLAPAERRPGAPGAWTVVDLPAGASKLWVAQGAHRQALLVNADASVPVLPGITGPQGPECLTAVIGGTIAGAPAPSTCPDQSLDRRDDAALRAMVRSLAGRTVPGIRLVGGDSPRAKAAAAAVKAEAKRNGIPVNSRPDDLDARVVVGSWEDAERALLVQRTSDPALSGVYLAPWHANGRLLGYSTGAVVVLGYDTTKGSAADYVAALDVEASRALASPAGFEAWLSADGRPQPVSTPRLYAALAGFTMMGVDPAMREGGDMDDMHGSTSGGWIPNGRMTPVSKRLS